MRVFLVLLLYAITAYGEANSVGPCQTATENDRTHWGHVWGVTHFEEVPLKRLSGIVHDLWGQPIPEALVEIFPWKKGEPDPVPSDDNARHRIAACITGAPGSFAFELNSGYYEVRVSRHDWNMTSTIVRVDQRMGRKKRLSVLL